MQAAMKRWLMPPAFPDDEEKTHRANLLHVILMTILVFDCLLILGILLGGNVPTSTLIIDITMLAALLLYLRLLHSGKIAFVGIGVAVFGFIFITGACMSLGTIRTPTTAIYLLWVIVIGIIFGLNGILISTIVGSLAVLGLILAENAGMLPHPDYTVTITQWISYTALFGLTGGATYYTNQLIRRALIRTEQEIKERKRTEKALRDSNQQLNLRVIEVEKLQTELREQALHDPLTGLYNRRYLSEMLVREVQRSEREQCQLSVIISDVDHFKKLNDTYGHQAGDAFLVAVARLMEHHIRESDFTCRYGGEEFVLILPGVTTYLAVKRAEAIRQTCADLTILYGGNSVTATMSFGVATYPDHGQAAEELIMKADKALYASKHTGRNRVTAWDTDQAAIV